MIIATAYLQPIYGSIQRGISEDPHYLGYKRVLVRIKASICVNSIIVANYYGIHPSTNSISQHRQADAEKQMRIVKSISGSFFELVRLPPEKHIHICLTSL